MKALFIGNSYTYYNDLPALLQALSHENGKDLSVFSVTKGGWRLHQYLDVENEYSEKLRSLLTSEHFDVAFLQEQSLLPILDFDAFRDGVTRLTECLRSKADRIVLYETWGRKEGSQALTEHGWTRSGMSDALSIAYHRVGAALGHKVSPVGEAFLALNTQNPDIELFNPDRTHPSYTGSCLAAAVHYQTLFGALPEKWDSLSLSAELLEAFKKIL